MCGGGDVCTPCVSVEGRGIFLGTGSLLPAWGPGDGTSVIRLATQVLLPTEPSYQLPKLPVGLKCHIEKCMLLGNQCTVLIVLKVPGSS